MQSACCILQSILFLLSCLLLSIQTVHAQLAQCTLCTDGSAPPNPDLLVDGQLSCQVYANFFSNQQDPVLCVAAQVTYGTYCGCSNANEEGTCRICGGESLLIDPAQPTAPFPGSQADNCIGLEFDANRNAVSCDSVQTGDVTDTCCPLVQVPTTAPVAGTTTQSPSVQPATAVPTLAPAMTQTLSPTLVPSVVPSTDSPMATPTLSPVQSQLPSSAPVVQETPEPSGSVVLTNAPTPAPLIQRAANFEGITFKLPGVGELDDDAQNNFESALQGWYDFVYRDNRRRRRLQQESIELKGFQTRVLYMDQSVDTEEATVVSYDQSVTYVRPVGEEDPDLRRVLLDPFDDEVAVEQLLARFQASDPFFADLDFTDLEAPTVPAPKFLGEDDDEDDLNIGMIIGIAAGGLVVLSIIVYFVACKRGKQGENPIEPPTESIKSRMQELPIEQKAEPAIPTESNNRRSTNSRGEENRSSRLQRQRSKSRSPGPDDGDAPLLSSGGSARSQRGAGEAETAEWMGVLGLESSGSEPMRRPKSPPYLERYEIVAPAGKLGVVIDTPTEGPPTVFAVKETSPLYGKIGIGDLVLQVDEEDVSTYSAMKVSRLIGSKAKSPERKFVLARQGDAP